MQAGEWIGGAQVRATAGQGAMGVVYRAYQRTLDRTVAVKVVAGHLASDPQFRARFQREARAAAELNHPHIVAVHDAGEDRGRLYLTMQYVDGRDLASMLQQFGPMPPDAAVEIVAQIASALDAAHERRLVHRDVKPANIMVVRRGQGWHAYLTDFGITMRLGEAGLTQTGTAVGTLDYMAPEQLVGDPYDHRADVYALGAVLFQALTGQVPFPRETDPARIYAHLNAEVPDLTGSIAVEGKAAGALSAVVRRALAKQPDERFGSAGELAAAARSALAGQAVPKAPRGDAYRPTGDNAASGRPRRRTLLLGGAGVLAVGAGAAVAGPKLFDRGTPTVTPSGSANLGLPKDTPAARASRRGPFDLSVEPTRMSASSDYLWANDQDSREMIRLDLVYGEEEKISVGGSPQDFALLTDRTVWVFVLDFQGERVLLQDIEEKTGTVGDDPLELPLGGGTALAPSIDEKVMWCYFEDQLVSVDLSSREVVVDVTIEEELSGLLPAAEQMLAIGRESRRLFRLDPKTGEQLFEPERIPEEVKNFHRIGKQTYAGSSEIGFGVLENKGFPRAADRRLKGYAIEFEADSTPWVVKEDTSEVFRARPDLSGVVGAPVPDLVAGDATLFASYKTQFHALEPSDKKVQVFDTTPLRKL